MFCEKGICHSECIPVKISLKQASRWSKWKKLIWKRRVVYLRLEMVGMAQNTKKFSFHWTPQVRVEKLVELQLAIKKTINLYKVNT